MQGRIAVGSNPWAMQFERDIRALQDVDDGFNLVHDLAGSCLRVFTDPPEQFVAIDCTALRRQYLSVAIPPPGFQDDAPLPALDVILEADLRFACDCKLDDGSACTAKFSSRHALGPPIFYPRRNTWQSTVTSQAAVSNVCSIFADKKCAKQHLQRSFKHGRCKGKGCTTVHEIQPISDMSCPYCETEHDNMDSLLQCITTHVDGPTPAQAVAQNAVAPE